MMNRMEILLEIGVVSGAAFGLLLWLTSRARYRSLQLDLDAQPEQAFLVRLSEVLTAQDDALVLVAPIDRDLPLRQTDIRMVLNEAEVGWILPGAGQHGAAVSARLGDLSRVGIAAGPFQSDDAATLLALARQQIGEGSVAFADTPAPAAPQSRWLDPLTGVLRTNRIVPVFRRFIQRARRNKRPAAVMVIDIDQLDQFNSLYGREAGDAVLKHVSQQLQATCREIDLISRLGDDEFAICLECDAETGLEISRRLCASVRQNGLIWQGNALYHTICIGLSLDREHARSVPDLIEAAEMALKDAKRRGRDHVSLFTPKMLP